MHEYGSDFAFEEVMREKSLIEKNIGKNTLYLRSCRECLRYILLLLKNKIDYVLLPAYSCKSVSLAFEEAGLNIKYYDIDLDMKPVLKISDINSRTAFLYINYFGKEILNYEQLRELKQMTNDFYIIKDSTQDYFENNVSIYEIIDFEVCSLRKWLPIMDGAVLHIFNYEIEKCGNPIIKDESWALERKEAMKLKELYSRSGDSDIKVQYRKIYATLNEELYSDKRIIEMSTESFEIYNSYDINLMKKVRQENAFVLHNELSVKANSSLYVSGKCSLYYPVLVEDRDVFQKKLAQQGVFCPVIWPLPQNAINSSKIAKNISDRILAIPCDQRYNQEDMRNISLIFREVLEEIKM